MTNDQAAQLARIETKLDRLLTDQDDLDKRVSSLERWRTYIVGGVASLTALLGLSSQAS
jgi:iron uptake system EfeUOB component EfeO/EfeM